MIWFKYFTTLSKKDCERLLLACSTSSGETKQQDRLVEVVHNAMLVVLLQGHTRDGARHYWISFPTLQVISLSDVSVDMVSWSKKWNKEDNTSVKKWES